MTDNDDDYRRGPGEHHRPSAPQRRYRRGEDRWAGHIDRETAISVPCRYCNAPAGAVCRNRHASPATIPFDQAPELIALPAHPIRVTDAKTGQP